MSGGLWKIILQSYDGPVSSLCTRSKFVTLEYIVYSSPITVTKSKYIKGGACTFTVNELGHRHRQ